MVDFDGKIAWDQSVRHTRVSSNFGKRIHPITNKFTGHTGIDMATNGTGHSVKALAEGTVRKVGWDSRAENGKTVGYGRYVVIEHDQGYFSLYGHLDKQSVKFKEGQKVFNGQIIAKSGNTGGSTAPHLHLEIAKGTKLADVFNKANKIDPKTIGDLQHLIDRSNVTFTFSSTQTNTTSTSQSMLQSVNNSKWGYGPSPQEMWDKMNGN
jgi:murein DD-endopeptidase MepM/ murein hydrolase activator NlpD